MTNGGYWMGDKGRRRGALEKRFKMGLYPCFQRVLAEFGGDGRIEVPSCSFYPQ